MLSILRASREMSGYVYFENKPSNGNTYFNVFLSAIKNSFIVNFEYKKFFEHHSTSRSVEPIALKEYKNRWYVLAKDLKDNYIKTFSLDRVIQPIISKNKFQKDTSFNIDKYFEYAYGITSPDEEKIYNIVLSFTPFQGKYIKSLPLHSSQKTLIDNEDEFRVQLTIYITHEFIMDILSYGSNVKIISPKKLVKEIITIYKKALNNYEI
jgi:predicted DNA-binding transcriptional regulator YafY